MGERVERRPVSHFGVRRCSPNLRGRRSPSHLERVVGSTTPTHPRPAVDLRVGCGVFAGCLRATAGGWLQTSARRSFGASECGGLRLVAEGEGCSPRMRVHSYGEWPGGWWLVTPRSPHGLPGVRGDVRLRSDMDVEKPGTTELAPTTESVIEWARHSARTDEQACSTRTSVRDVGVDQASRLPGNAVLRRCGTGRPADCSGGVSLLAARGQTV